MHIAHVFPYIYVFNVLQNLSVHQIILVIKNTHISLMVFDTSSEMRRKRVQDA